MALSGSDGIGGLNTVYAVMFWGCHNTLFLGTFFSCFHFSVSFCIGIMVLPCPSLSQSLPLLQNQTDPKFACVCQIYYMYVKVVTSISRPLSNRTEVWTTFWDLFRSNEVKDSMPGSVVPLAIFFLCNIICTYIMLANVCTAVVISLKINFILRNWRRAGKNEACHCHLMKEPFWWFEEEKSFQLFTIVNLQGQVKHCSSI